jgi:hypothetical protein
MAMKTKIEDKTNRIAACFRRGEAGSPAVEFAIIAPVFILMIFGIVQFGFAFYTYNDMMNGAREGARRMAVGATVVDARARALEAMVLDRPYVFVDPVPPAEADEVIMRIELRLADAMAISVLPLPAAVTDKKIIASVTMYKE